MAADLYEAMMTKNGQLAKFFDECHESAKMTIKLIRLISMIAVENHVAADEITFEVFCPKGGNVLVVRMKHPKKTITT